MSNIRASIPLTICILIASAAIYLPAQAAETLVGDWVQTQSGERMSIAPSNAISFQPPTGSAINKGVANFGALPQGGNMDIRFTNGTYCVYRTTVLQRGALLNLKLLTGPESKSSTDGCIFGVFAKATTWPDASPAPNVTPPDPSAEPNSKASKSTHLFVKHVAIRYRRVTPPYSGTVVFAWQSPDVEVEVTVPYQNAITKDSAISQAFERLNTLSPSTFPKYE